MRVSTQVRIVFWSVASATALLALNTALSAAALIHLNGMHIRMISPVQLAQVRADLTSSLSMAAVSVLVLAVLTLFLRRPSSRIRYAVMALGPLIALVTLCFLVGGPEWAVAPTGNEPDVLKAEYASAVPSWYTGPHGVAGVVSAALLIFVAVFMVRADLREYYMDAGYDPSRPYKSWVERTGGP
ncbi:hypothetical protein [Dactylosporangium darangshiense]|uniref:Uncharacterized protein n=1 Tax=Dactylosporangium darangshiense TaxID=579108 RepID=A0ABP8D8R4_9ACTN